MSCLKIGVEQSVKMEHRRLESGSVHALMKSPRVESRLDAMTDLDVFLLHLVRGSQ